MSDQQSSERGRFGASVLVIDDEPGLGDMLRYGLAKRGFRVECAATGEEGLTRLRREPFDLVVCDIRMPGLSGVEVLGRIKDIAPETPVIMATGFATVETAIESMKKGAFDYITKPYGLPQMCSILEKALEWRKLRARVDHLEEMHRLKDEFMATVSHELRTPITVIMGFASLLRDTVHNEEEHQKGLRTIEAKAKGLLQIINNIIDLANVSAKREPVVIETFAIADVAREVCDALRPVAEAKKLELSLEVAPELTLETDRTKVRQILVHLVDNGIKFTAAGRIAVRLEPDEADSVRLIVTDTGMGIEAQHIPLIFQEFRQVDQSYTRRHGGTGLGLAVCKKFVELLGGAIAVESVPGKGSVFTVTLPGRRPKAKPAGPAQKTPAGHPRAGAGSQVLLVVDDDPSIVRLFQNLLAREGYAARTAGGGQEALAKMGLQKPDVLLLDLMMPDLTGFEVLDRMSKDPSLQGIKVFIITARDLTEEERAQLRPRVELIIRKGSMDLPEILALINQQLRRSSGG